MFYLSQYLLIVEKINTSTCCPIIYAIMEPTAILGTKSNIVDNDFEPYLQVGIKCSDICITIIITNVEENPNHTALFATLRPYMSFSISVAK